MPPWNSNMFPSCLGLPLGGGFFLALWRGLCPYLFLLVWACLSVEEFWLSGGVYNSISLIRTGNSSTREKWGANAHSNPGNSSTEPASSSDLDFSKNYRHCGVRFWTFDSQISDPLRKQFRLLASLVPFRVRSVQAL